jgi:5'-nucleotidase/UDP-sugar diphosphatase
MPGAFRTTGPTRIWLLLRGAVLLAALLAAGCGSTREGGAERPAAEVRITLLQLNDVYEITPVQGGREGGLARVATLRKRLIAENPHTFTVLAGDFFSPSALGTARVDGERLGGRPMVDVLNALGLDYATFGNHEFDVDEAAFYDLLAQAAFDWVSANVTSEAGTALPGVAPYRVLDVRDAGGRAVRLGLFGVTLASSDPGYVRIDEPLLAAERTAARLRDSVDVLVALTHLTLAQDRALAEAVEPVDLILGGHEHENIQVWRGADLTPICKADANARTVYVHDLYVDPATGRVRITSQLVPITEGLPEDPETATVVEAWVARAFAAFRENGFEPDRTVAVVGTPLDGLEASVRHHPTALTALIAEGMRAEAGAVDAALFNSGAVRIDDVIQPGPLSVYDVIRILPFGGTVLTVEVDGVLLERVLNQGVVNQGTGGYLQTAGVTEAAPGRWQVGGAPLAPERTYRVAVNDFLVSGREDGLEFFSLANPDVRKVAEHRDVRLALIDQVRRAFPER